MKKYLPILLLLLILALGAFFRFWKLDTLPPGLYPDVAVNGTDAIHALETNKFQVFYPANNGREGLFINLVAFSFFLFGVSVWSIKMVAALAGVVTVFGLYLLAKELFGQKIALISSFFLVCSFWHLNFSRIGFRAILVPLILVFLFYFLFRGFKYLNSQNSSRIFRLAYSSFILAGLFCGLGFYTYLAFRVVPLILIILLISAWLYFRKIKKAKIFFQGIALFMAVAFLIALPLAIYFLNHPQDVFSRAGGISVFVQPNPAKAFGESTIKTLGMFNFQGDPNWRHNFSGSPMLFWPVGILFLAGLILAFVGASGVLRKRKLAGVPHCSGGHPTPALHRSAGDPSRFAIRPSQLAFVDFIKRQNYILLLLWFFIMLLPAILTAEGLPHALRSIGVIPVVYILAALPLAWLLEIKKGKIWITFLVLVFLVFVGVYDFHKYFYVWANRVEVKNEFRTDLVYLGQYLNDLPKDVKRYIIVNEGAVLVEGIPVQAQTIKFITYQKSQNIYLVPENIKEIKPEGKTFVVMLMYDPNLIKKLYSVFPYTHLEKIEKFYVFSN